MIKLRFSLLMALLMVVMSVWADNAPAKAQAALKKMYPKADGIAWSQDNGYEKNVWFNAQGQWQMTQTEWGDTDELSATVYNAFASGPYSGWQVEDVTYVEFPKWQPIIVIKVGQQNVDIQYQLFYSPNGALLRTRNVSYMDDILGPGTFL
mgnify:CR=1 FL=1